MGIILGIVAIAFVLVTGLVVLAFLIGDIKKAKKYNKAARVQGVVYENCGIERVASYGRNQYRKYARYVIRYDSPMGERTQSLLLKNKDLQKGDIVEVRYIKEGNDIQLIDNISNVRLLELLISFSIVIIICIMVFLIK